MKIMKKIFLIIAFLILTINLSACSVQDDLNSSIQKGYLAGVTKAIEKKADINFTDKNGITPIILAAKNEKFDILEMLTKAGANVNQTDPETKKNVLQFVLEKGTTKMALDLLDKGANLYYNDSGKTAIDIAIETEKFDFLANVYANKQDLDNAIKYSDMATYKNNKDYISICYGADAYTTKAKSAQDLDKKINLAQTAIEKYNQALSINANAPIGLKPTAETILNEANLKKQGLEEQRIAEERKIAEEKRIAEATKIAAAKSTNQTSKQNSTSTAKSNSKFRINDTVRKGAFLGTVLAIDGNTVQVNWFDCLDMLGMSSVKDSPKELGVMSMMSGGIKLGTTKWYDESELKAY